ncbi:MAG: YfhO family protein [Lachnospiraceae bacterium]
MKKAEKRRYFFLYTVCFIVLAFAMFFVFLVDRRSFIWKPDGLQQHFNALLYYRRYLREFFHRLFVEHRFSLPLWDASIGLGSDVLTTLHYYVIGDPLNLLSALVPSEAYMEVFFSGLVVLRMYLAGLAFSVYCFAQEKETFPTLLGALIYAFCFWCIVSIRHPYFLNPLIYLPLILLGVDRIYKKKKAGLYMVMLAVAAVSSFYFTYMICIFILFYALIRYLMLFPKIRLKQVFSWIGRFLVYSLTALAMAAAILLPVITMMFSTGRAKAQNYLPAVYPLSYYVKLFFGFLNGGSGYWSNLGYTAFGVLGIILLFTYKNRYKALKAGCFLMLILLLVPFGGHIMNGGSYVINRYMWACSMLVSYIVVKAYTLLLHMDLAHKQRMMKVSLLYLAFGVAYCICSKDKSMLFPLFLFWVLLLLLFIAKPQKYTRRPMKVALLVLLMMSLAYQGYEKYDPNGENYASEFAEWGEAYASLKTDAPSAQIAEKNPKTFCRYEEFQTGEWKNTAMQQNLHGTAYYFSLANPAINQFQRELYMNQSRDFCYSNLDGRSPLDLLFSVRYFLIPSQRKELCPYGFDSFVSRSRTDLCAKRKATKAKPGKAQKQWTMTDCYENPQYLPLGFTSANFISRESYEKMTVTQKQQALLQGVVLEDSTLREVQPLFTDHEISYQIEEMQGVMISDHTIQVTQNNATATLTFTGMPDSETYFIIKGLQYSDTDTSQFLEREKDRVHIEAACGAVSKKIIYLSSKNNFYSDIHEYLLNLGYRKDAAKTIQLKFPEKGTFTYDQMQVVCQPMATFRTSRDVLGKECLQNVKMENNELTGEITVSKDKLLCISFPYSDGWSAYVDGKKTEVKQADTMFLGLELKKGHHTVQLCYCTPTLEVGLIITFVGIIVFFVLLWCQRKRKSERRMTWS